MSDKETILDKAAELGGLIADSDAATRLKEAQERLQSDVTARQAIQNFNQYLQGLAVKEQSGQPIEVSEKQEVERLQTELATNLTLQSYQQAQMAYVQFMREVDQAITGAGPDPLSAPGQEQQPQQDQGGSQLIY